MGINHEGKMVDTPAIEDLVSEAAGIGAVDLPCVQHCRPSDGYEGVTPEGRNVRSITISVSNTRL